MILFSPAIVIVLYVPYFASFPDFAKYKNIDSLQKLYWYTQLFHFILLEKVHVGHSVLYGSPLKMILTYEQVWHRNI